MPGLFDFIKEKLTSGVGLFTDPKETAEEVKAAQEICQFVTERKDQNIKTIQDDLPLDTLLFDSNKKREEGTLIFVLLAIECYLSNMHVQREEMILITKIKKLLEAKRKHPYKDVKNGSEALMEAISQWSELTNREASTEEVSFLRKTFFLSLHLSIVAIKKLQKDGGYKLYLASNKLGNLDEFVVKLNNLKKKLISSEVTTPDLPIETFSQIAQKTIDILHEGVGHAFVNEQLLQVADSIKELMNPKKEAMQRQKSRADAIVKMVTENSHLVVGQQYFTDLIAREEIGGREGFDQFLSNANEENGFKEKLKEILKQYENPSVYRNVVALGQYATSWITAPVTIGFRWLAPEVVQTTTNALITTLDGDAKLTLLQLAQAESARVEREIQALEAIMAKQSSTVQSVTDQKDLLLQEATTSEFGSLELGQSTLASSDDDLTSRSLASAEGSQGMFTEEMRQLIQELVTGVHAVRKEAVKKLYGEKKPYVISFLMILEEFIPRLFYWGVKKEKTDPVLNQDPQKEHHDAKEVLDDCRKNLRRMEALQKKIKKQSPQSVLEGVSVSKGRFEEETEKTLKDRVKAIREEVERIETSIPIDQGKSPR